MPVTLRVTDKRNVARPWNPVFHPASSSSSSSSSSYEPTEEEMIRKAIALSLSEPSPEEKAWDPSFIPHTFNKE
jgi:hypothetical protein